MGTRGEVVIIGGGAVGCAVAYYLSQAGITATLVERERIGGQASGYSAGGLNPLQGLPPVLQPLAMAAFHLHLDLWQALPQLTSPEGRGSRITVVKVAMEEREIPALQAEMAPFTCTPGFHGQWLDRDTLRQEEPRLSAGVLGGIAVSGNGIVDSYQYTAILAAAAQQAGATVRTGTVRGLQQTQGRVTGVQVDDTVLPCDAVVVATGPWVQAVETWLGLLVPVTPLKGEILRLQLDGPPLAQEYASAEVHLFLRGDQVWCGATEEARGFDQAPSDTARRDLLARGVRLFPAIANATLVQHTACLRPVATDGLPILGQAPGWDNVYLATGGGKKGILLSPAMGKAIADLLSTGSTALDIAACTPHRFAVATA